MTNVRITTILSIALIVLGITLSPVICKMTESSKNQSVLQHLPKRLHFIIEPVLKYGTYRSHQDLVRFASSISEEDRDELFALNQRLTHDDYEDIAWFLDCFPMAKHEDSARIEYLWRVMDAVIGETSEKDVPAEEQLRRRLKDLNRFGSTRLMQNRRWTARWFAENPPIPSEAIPLLRAALEDESPLVRIWAHAAMATVDKDPSRHRQAVLAIARSTPPDSTNFIAMRDDADLALRILAMQDQN